MTTLRFSGTKTLTVALALLASTTLIDVGGAGATTAPIVLHPSTNALVGIRGGAYMTGLYCFTDSDCVAVGQDSSEDAIVLNGNPASWTASDAEQINNTGGGALNAVTCTSATTCIAVGNTNAGEPLILSGNPATWGTAQAQVFTFSHGGDLDAITCTSSTACIAVGEYSTNFADVPIQLTGNPASWTSSDISVITLGTTFDSGGDLYAITCTSVTACVAVGDDNYEQPFSITGDPATWTTSQGAEITLTDALGTGGYLDAISCTSATQCTAAGSDGNEQPLVVTGDPATWTVAQASETTLGGTFGTGGYLNGISCSSATLCTAAGSDGNSDPLVLTGNPTTWTSVDATKLTLGTSFGSGGEFDTLACLTSSDCVAVGSDQNDSPLSIVGDPTTWTASGVVGVDLTGAALGALANINSIDCSTPTSCVSVGSDFGDGLFTMHGNPTKWNDAHAEQLGSSFDGELTSVSCVSTTSCVAVGDSYGSASVFGNFEPIVVRGNPATWTGAQVKEYKLNSSFGSAGAFTAVTCTSKFMCVAVGYDFTGQPIVLQGNPSTWKTVDVKPLKIGTNGYLRSVTCTSPTNCVGVGETSSNRLWSVSGNPTKWNKTDTKVIVLSKTLGVSGLLESVSCSSATLCVAVGTSGRSDPIVLDGNPATWGAAQVINLTVPKATSKTVTGYGYGNGQGDTKGELESVSCTSAIHCFAMGGDESGAPIFIQGNPAKWRGQSTERLVQENQFESATLGASSCAGTTCFGGGESTGGVFLAKL